MDKHIAIFVNHSRSLGGNRMLFCYQSIRSTALMYICATACGASPDHDKPDDTSAEGAIDTTSSASSTTPATSSTGESSVGSDTTTEQTSSEQTSNDVSTGTDLPLEVLCHAARSEAECGAVDEFCRWYPSQRVADLASCTLDNAVGACWATDPTGGQGCFGLWPLACYEADIQPIYREIDGSLYLMDLEGACQWLPRAPEGEPSWTFCPSDETTPAPEVCYCLCPAAGGSESSSG